MGSSLISFCSEVVAEIVQEVDDEKSVVVSCGLGLWGPQSLQNLACAWSVAEKSHQSL